MFTNRMTLDDLPETIPLFPLQDALLLPGGLLPLNIFEECYIRMIDDALQSHRMIGMILPDMKAREGDNNKAIYQTGCVGRITQFSEMDDDRYMIMLSGLCRFRIAEELKTVRPYRQAQIEWEDYADDLVADCDSIEINRAKFLPLLKQYLAMHEMQCDWSIVEETPCERLLTTLPMVCPFSTVEKQALLEAKTYLDRYEILYNLIQIELGDKNVDKFVKH